MNFIRLFCLNAAGSKEGIVVWVFWVFLVKVNLMTQETQ